MIITDDALTTLKRLETDSIQCCISSPPYNVGIRYENYDDKRPYPEYIEWLTDVFVSLKDVLVDGGRLCLNIAPTGIKNFSPSHHDLITKLRKNGYRFVSEIIWYKQNWTAGTAWGSWKSPSCPYVLPSWEYVYVLQKGGKRLAGENPDITKEEFQKYIDGHWDIKPETQNKGNPAPFPEELVYRLIKLYTYPGDTVIDPFMGSGTVGVVCKRLQRKFIGVDTGEKYCNEAAERIAREERR